jgi:hypothetical protein
MKKLTILFFTALFCGIGTSYGQGVEQMTNKNGVNILPEAGQFAIGFDALPFLRFAGNMFNGNTANTVNAAFPNFGGSGAGGTLYGKYFLSETMAIRGRVGIFQSTTQVVNRVMLDGQAVPQSNIEVEDEMIAHSFNFELGGGIEFRRGKGRLMGVYGGEIFVNTNASNRSYTYGNALTADNQAPGTSNFGGNVITPGQRVTSAIDANSFGVGARGFAGVEYFFAPQISLGAEFNLGIAYTGTNRSARVTEEWDDTNAAILEITDLNAGTLTNFGVATGVWGGSLNLMFHF